MKSRATTLATVTTVLLLGGATSAWADRTFQNPTINGQGVDICLNFGVDCGKPAADAFCDMQGMGASTNHAIQNDSPPTYVIGAQAVCQGGYCDRFSSISCEADPQPLVIDDPVINGYAVDICLGFGTDCGQAAADAYCQANDWGTAVDYTIQNDSPPTYVIGAQAVCQGGYCDRFSSISCRGF